MKGLLYGALAALTVGCLPNAQARSLALEVLLPPVQGWQITATQKLSSVTCYARRKDTDGQRLALSAKTGTTPDPTWDLQITSRQRALEAGVERAAASLIVDGSPVATGSALAIGDSRGSQRVSRYVRFEFPALHDALDAILEAPAVELHTPGLAPLNIESLPPAITALEQCQRDSVNAAFWNKAIQICN